MAEEGRAEKAQPEAAKEEEIRVEQVSAEEVKAHRITLSMVKVPPAEVAAGTYIVLQGRVLCSSACDLRGKIVRILTQDAVVSKEISLVIFDGAAYETDPIVIKAPTEPGAYSWTGVFPAQEKEGVLHEEGSAPVSFTVMPHHTTSIADWDVPSPIAFGDEFGIKVGVRCSADCRLTDKNIEIYDHAGAVVATVALGGIPWPGTSALYWAEVKLKAPTVEGYFTWEVKFSEQDSAVPHDGASYTFGFSTTRQPEHVVTVGVIDKDTQTPIKNADVLLHPYRGYTDECGMARLMVPKGEYELYVSESGKETFQTTVKVASDVAVKAELLSLPVPDDSG
ncbi:MAG: hypothetical protein HY650_11030 [Acidobacteria bacterium]|nr:hypothetical protein [Acidobacteriota bacterium]